MPRSRHALPAAAQALHFASAPYTPTAVEEQRYHDLMQEARYSIEAREEEGQARARLMHAQAGLDQVNVFFFFGS